MSETRRRRIVNSTILWAAIGGIAAGAPEASAETSNEPQVDRIEDVIVTARRREEQLQRTPVSVVSFTGAELEARSVTNLRDLQGFVPNLTLAPQQNVGEGSGNIFIRGIGQEDFIAGSELGVALYLDGVYSGGTRGTIFDLNDIERIEVLRGPQGTLFGKNSTGGAIQIVSVKPQPLTGARGRFTFGSFERNEQRAMLNLPIGDQLLSRLSLLRVSREGFMVRLPPPFDPVLLPPLDLSREGGESVVAARLQIRWQPRDGLLVDLAGDASRKRNPQSAHRLERADPQSSGILAINQLIALGLLPGPQINDANLPRGFFETYATGRQKVAIDERGLSATALRELSSGSLRLILSYRTQSTLLATEGDGVWFDIENTEFNDDLRQFTSELKYDGVIGPIDLTAGLFFMDQRTLSSPTKGLRSNGTLYTCGCFYRPDQRPELSTIARDQETKSRAAYIQGAYQIAQRLSASLGGRLTRESKSIESNVILVDGDTLIATDTVLESGAARDSWTSFTYRAGLDFQASEDIFLYASAAKGFKSGGFNIRTVSGLPNLGMTSFEPETNLTFELGLRSQWLDRHLRFNATVFRGDYRNLQLRQQKVINNTVTSQVDNAGEARIQGFETELEALPVTGLKLRAALGRLHARYLDVSAVPGVTRDSRFQRTPSHSFAVSASYIWPVRRGFLTVDGSYTYRSKEQFQIVSSPYDQSGYGLASARVTWRPAAADWSLSIFGTNLTNRHYRVAGRNNGTIVGMPRQLGITLEVGFGESVDHRAAARQD